MSRPHSPQHARSHPSSQKEELFERRFLALMQESADVFWYLSPTGEMRDPSSSWRTFTGQLASQCLGRGWLDALHPADQPSVETLLQQAALSGQTTHLECHIRRSDNVYRLIHASAISVRLGEEAIGEIIVYGTDITKQELA